MSCTNCGTDDEAFLEAIANYSPYQTPSAPSAIFQRFKFNKDEKVQGIKSFVDKHIRPNLDSANSNIQQNLGEWRLRINTHLRKPGAGEGPSSPPVPNSPQLGVASTSSHFDEAPSSQSRFSFERLSTDSRKLADKFRAAKSYVPAKVKNWVSSEPQPVVPPMILDPPSPILPRIPGVEPAARKMGPPSPTSPLDVTSFEAGMARWRQFRESQKVDTIEFLVDRDVAYVRVPSPSRTEASNYFQFPAAPTNIKSMSQRISGKFGSLFGKINGPSSPNIPSPLPEGVAPRVPSPAFVAPLSPSPRPEVSNMLRFPWEIAEPPRSMSVSQRISSKFQKFGSFFGKYMPLKPNARVPIPSEAMMIPPSGLSALTRPKPQAWFMKPNARIGMMVAGGAIASALFGGIAFAAGYFTTRNNQGLRGGADQLVLDGVDVTAENEQRLEYGFTRIPVDDEAFVAMFWQIFARTFSDSEHDVFEEENDFSQQLAAMAESSLELAHPEMPTIVDLKLDCIWTLAEISHTGFANDSLSKIF